ncbi:MAG: TIGR01620 family protein [Methylobacteriaceae bacterium]|nr:TIGR01620 family protein [Methylobacteriaceae bacterium]
MTTPPRPRAFRLDDPDIVFAERDSAPRQKDGKPPPEPREPSARSPGQRSVIVEAQPDPYEREAANAASDASEAATEAAQASGIARRRTWTWGRLFWSALASLVSLAVGLWFASIVDSLFARSLALGWLGIALLAIVGIALLALLIREVVGVARQSRIARLHAAIAAARAADDRDAARRLVLDVARIYAARAETARARTELADLTREIVDGRDLIDIAERRLMHPLDARVRHEIAAAAKRVSAVTAISPRALLDVLFVAAQAVHIMRRIAEIYGGRPGLFGFFKLLRSVTAHLAITGGMAVGDSIVQQVLGHGIAARISARLGEGVLNGLLTARIGLSAMAVCRPMPFAAERPPGIRDVAPFLFAARKE